METGGGFNIHGKAWEAESSDDEGENEEEEGVAANQLPLKVKIDMAKLKTSENTILW